MQWRGWRCTSTPTRYRLPLILKADRLRQDTLRGVHGLEALAARW